MKSVGVTVRLLAALTGRGCVGKGLGTPTKPLNEGCQLAPGEAQQVGEAWGEHCTRSPQHMCSLNVHSAPGAALARKKALKKGGGC